MDTCFVILPSTASFDVYYREIFVRAIQRSGLQPVRAPDLDKHEAIRDQIPAGVAEAAMCIADLTGRSTTVLYVLGMAHAMGKPLVLVAQSMDDLPYDLRFGTHVLYRPGTARWEDMLSLQLQSAIRETVNVTFGTGP